MLKFKDVAVAGSGIWSTHSNTTLNDKGFTQRAQIPLSGVTLAHSPDVRWDAADMYAGVWSGFADTYAGGMYLYATEATATSIPVVLLTEDET